MISESERLKQLRKALNMKQGDFAEKISTTQGHISDIENGRKSLSDRTSKLICLEEWNGKKVNEEWLQSGKGEMFIQRTRTEKITDFAADILKEEDESFRRRLVEALADLDMEEWELLEKIAEKAVRKGKS